MQSAGRRPRPISTSVPTIVRTMWRRKPSPVTAIVRARPPASAAAYAARLGVRPVDLKTAHDPMVSAPDALARLLEKLAG